MATEGLEQAVAVTRDVLQNVKPDQLDNDTPCESWKLRDVINHVVNASKWFGTSIDAGEAPPPFGVDYADTDFVKAFDDNTKETVAAFGKPGAMEKPVKMPFGEFPGQMLIGLATNDIFTHGWDIAKATGQDTNLDPALATQILSGVKMAIPDAFRGPDTQAPFGPKVECDDSVPPADQLASFLGRKI